MDKSELINYLIKEKYIKSVAVEKAFMRVKRENFLPDELRGMAYFDTPLQILSGQTISAPSMIAIMLEAAELRPGLKVLEIGTGSGYNAALLAEIVGQENVVTIERIPELARYAKKKLEEEGYSKIRVIEGDGSLGYEKEAPYDRIIATAAAPKVPYTWEAQLKAGGLIVAPIGGRHFYQELIVVKKNSDGRTNQSARGHCVFVPLIGEEGWSS